MGLLNIKDLWVQYGKLIALHNFSIDVEQGATVAIIGANGAGKSTLLRAISGLIKRMKGEIYFDGVSTDHMKPHEVVRAGLSYCPQEEKTFPGLTVSENLSLGAYARRDPEGIKRDLDRIYGLFPVLSLRKRQSAGSLSGGEQQMLALGQALMKNTKLLLLDEPSTGLGPMVVNEVGKVLQGVRSEGMTVVLVEQNCTLAFQQADEVYVLEQGETRLKGTVAEMQGNPYVREAYLGI
jgi:branched-chain amino acid transport system ATP-binding protein